MYTDLALYIDGKWVNGGGRKGEDVLNPATEKPLAHLPHASKADLDEALEAAKKGFALWRATSAYDRPRSCARPPTSCASATTRSRKCWCRSRARSTPRRAPRSSPRPTSSTGTRRRAAAATAASYLDGSRARASWW